MLLNSSEQNRTDVESLLWERIFSLCIQRGWDIGRLAREAGVSRTTLHHWQQGKTARPRNSTIYKLAEALEVDPARLLGNMEIANPAPVVPPNADAVEDLSDNGDFGEQARFFDRQTNWAIQSVCEQFPSLFEDWGESQWDELFSSFGTGGELNEEGIRLQAEAINAQAETLYQLKVVLETHLADAARGVIRSLYESIQCSENVSSPEKTTSDWTPAHTKVNNIEKPDSE